MRFMIQERVSSCIGGVWSGLVWLNLRFGLGVVSWVIRGERASHLSFCVLSLIITIASVLFCFLSDYDSCSVEYPSIRSVMIFCGCFWCMAWGAGSVMLCTSMIV